MTPDRLLTRAIRPALSLLPEKMRSDEAEALLVAIALQESRIQHRRQIHGPARGYWQFERGGGVVGVLTHLFTKDPIRDVLQRLDYPVDAHNSQRCHLAIEHNDILAAAFARCFLWILPDELPGRIYTQNAWEVYLKAWRPGKPHRETWDAWYHQAWAVVGAQR